MHFIEILLVPVLMCTIAASISIISVGSDISENDISMGNSSLDDEGSNILETIYARQSFGKSHRFYFNVGERKDGDALLDDLFKQTGWKNKTDAQVNVTYPADGKNTKNVTYVTMIVYQGSDINRIRIFEGGIGQPNIGISIVANQTRYLTYKVSIYGA